MVESVGDPLKTMLKSINVRHNERINAIECTFNSGRTSGWQGGQWGNEGSFQLNENERIVQIEGRAGERINRLQFVTNLDRRSDVFGGGEGSPFIWTPPSTDDHMCLLCFQGRAGREVDRLNPVWAVDPPIKFELDITNFVLPDPSTIGQPKEAWTTVATTENKTSKDVPKTLTWQRQLTKSCTISNSKTTRLMLGGKVSMSTSVKGQAGVPLLTSAEVTVTAGIEISTEAELGTNVTDGKATTHQFTETISDTVTVPPNKRTRGVLTGYELRVQGVKWTGKMTVIYAGGDKKTFDIDGTFDSVNATKYNTKFTEEAL